MRYFDVFNGDADGICALHQLRLADPVDSILITGLKRDIALLGGVPASDGDVVNVLDISLDRNRAALDVLLGRGAVVHYFDHHYAGDIPRHPALLTQIDPEGATCTSALVDRYLGGRYRIWAVVGAFGDNLDGVALALARTLGLDEARLRALQELGVDLNYAAYGEMPGDLLVHPAALYSIVHHYADPFELMAAEPVIGRLATERAADLESARATKPLHATDSCDAWILPDKAWARRVIGAFANRLSQQQPQRAHAVLVPRSDGALVVSVRAPQEGGGARADALCRHFPTGGGRADAAGIDRLDRSRLDEFLGALDETWRR